MFWITKQTLKYIETRKRIQISKLEFGKNDPLHNVQGRLKYVSIVLGISMVNELWHDICFCVMRNKFDFLFEGLSILTFPFFFSLL